MRRVLILITLVFTLAQAFTVHAARNLEVLNDTSRHALVIGNNTYQSVGPLEKASNDASAVGQALEKIGYQTTVLLDANRSQMNTAINRFVDDIAGGGVGVLFFAGHGVQINNQNYLLPVDMEAPRSEADIGDQAISLQSVQDKIAQARARFTLLVIDACRNNPLPQKAGRSLGATRGLALASSAEGQMVIFSAGANQLALDKLYPDDRDPNGLFTRELLPWLSKPGINVRQAVQEVRRAVYAKAKGVNHDQFPAVYDQVLGDFYFVSKLGPVEVLHAPPLSPSVAAPVSPIAAPLPVPPASAAPVIAHRKPEPPTLNPPPAAGLATRSGLTISALGLPTYRSFWNGMTQDAYTRQLRTALAQAGGGLLDMAPRGLELGRKEFDAWWYESDKNPRSRELCTSAPAPRALLAARVETPPVFFTDLESAYWPELKMRLVVCADLRTFSQSKTLSPQRGEAWPFATEFNSELDRFLRERRGELSN